MKHCFFLLVAVLVVGDTSFAQKDEEPKVSRGKVTNRVYVNSNHSSAVVFEYARSYFPEGRPVSDTAIQCFRAEMKRTGLVKNVSVVRRSIGMGKFDVYINPSFQHFQQKLVITDIVFKGFGDVSEFDLEEELARRGLEVGSAFEPSRIGAMKAAVYSALASLSDSDVRRQNDVQERAFNLAVRMLMTSENRVQVTFVASRDDFPDANITTLSCSSKEPLEVP